MSFTANAKLKVKQRWNLENKILRWEWLLWEPLKDSRPWWCSSYHPFIASKLSLAYSPAEVWAWALYYAKSPSASGFWPYPSLDLIWRPIYLMLVDISLLFWWYFLPFKIIFHPWITVQYSLIISYFCISHHNIFRRDLSSWFPILTLWPNTVAARCRGSNICWSAE